MARCGASVHVRDPLPPSKPRVLLPVRVLGHSTVCVALRVLVCMSRRVGVSRKRARPLSRGGTIESDELHTPDQTGNIRFHGSLVTCASPYPIRKTVLPPFFPRSITRCNTELPVFTFRVYNRRFIDSFFLFFLFSNRLLVLFRFLGTEFAHG